jgi:hypothetical protein
MRSDDITRFQPVDQLLVDFGSDIWRMDDRCWAVYVWQRFGIGVISRKGNCAH